MQQELKWKSILVVFLLLLSTVLILPTFVKDLPTWYKKFFSTEGIKLGLDLQGGMHLILRVDIDKALQNSLELLARDLKDALAEKGITIIRKRDESKPTFILTKKDDLPKVKDIIKNEFSDLEIEKVIEEPRFTLITVKLSNKYEDFLRNNLVDQSLEIIRNRIDQFGVTEPIIAKQGTQEIVVQLPGVKDPQRAINIIGQTAVLEFKLVVDDPNIDPNELIRTAQSDGRLPKEFDTETLNNVLRPLLPRDTIILPMKETDELTKKETTRYVLLKEKPLMTGESIKTAFVQVGGNFNEPYVALQLTERGAKIFDKITSENIGKRLAIVLDGVVRSAPVIRERISGGHAQITGSFTHEEASDLALVLRAGALPAPVNIIQNITVGPSLGKDSIQQGLVAGLFGGACVLIFMMVYYYLSGVIANIAMFLNILFLFAVMSALQATLTLPGIAGIILTIGMGVDSNVLILERMREEKRLGKTIIGTVDGGYNKAFWTIVDSHITTLITAFALFLFGTGPIKGFAVTLSSGILINLFTAIFCTKLAYDFLISSERISDVRFMQVVQDTKIKFMSYYKYAFGFSAVILALGFIALFNVFTGKANLGVDFTGGSLYMYKSNKPIDISFVRSELNKQGIDAVIQDVPNENKIIIKIKKEDELVSNFEEKIEKIYKMQPDTEWVLESKNEIGASVSKDLRNKAFIAIAISLAGILVYLAFRFTFSFGVAAAIATFHDVIATLAVIYILGLEINLLIVTALLTIAGYSLTDTVVIFDRIREVIRLEGERLGFVEIINKSLNDILARTIITSLTTLFASISLALFGGIVIRDFALAVTIGVIFGTYSSIFIASPLVYLWHRGVTPKIG